MLTLRVNIVQYHIYFSHNNHFYSTKWYLDQKNKLSVFQQLDNRFIVCGCSGSIMFSLNHKKMIKMQHDMKYYMLTTMYYSIA